MNTNLLLNMSKIGRNGTGLYNYSCSVIEALKKTARPFEVLVGSNIRLSLPSEQRRSIPECMVGDSKISILKPLMWQAYMLFKSFSADYVMATTHHLLRTNGKQIVTIHDIRPYYYPDSILQRLYFRYFLPRILGGVSGIITVSEFTKKCLVTEYGIEPSKIQVVPNVVDTSEFVYDPSIPKEKYLLVVGGTYYHKNIHEIIENSDIWSDEYRLYIVAGSGKYKEQLMAMVRDKNLTARVLFLENVPRDELISLYQRASALVYPSLVEGFGIPPIEAMATGTPVICSDIPVFREIYDDIPLYVTLGDRGSWERAFRDLRDQKFIEPMLKEGLAKSQAFSQEHFNAAFYRAVNNLWPEFMQ